MARKYQIISGDGHIETPPRFVEYVPEKYKDRAPRLITLPDGGGDAWVMEGMPLAYASQNLKGRGTVKFAGQSYTESDGSPAAGAGDGAQRLREQDEDGIDAELLFAPVFAARFFEKIPDHDAYLAMVQGYNTWLAEDYCVPAPDRLIANALVPISGIDDAISELERARRLGLKSVQLMMYPNGGPAPKPEDDRFWEKALELDMPLSPHISFGGPINTGAPRHDTSLWPPEAGMIQHAQMRPCDVMAQMIVHRVFERIPELHFYFAEINAATFPAALWYMDRDYHEYNDWFQVELPKEPSQYMRDHAIYGMIAEPFAIRMGEEMPAEMPLELFVWGSDFPHSVGTFPHSQEYIEKAWTICGST
jgi:predicted TIM-barrel fold metal-dependent hydrolase